MPRLTLPLAFLLAAGCTVDAPPPVASPYGATHRASAFQQFCEQAWNVPHASALVAARGADGWELVAMYNGALCYKRPVFEARRQLGPSAPAGPPGAPGSFVPLVRDPGF